MENITLGQLQNFFIFIIALVGSVVTITKAVKTSVEKGLKPINDKIDRVDKNATMNYLVSRINDVDNGDKLTGVSKKRFFDEYQHYTQELHGNSYISEEVERLKKEGKI